METWSLRHPEYGLIEVRAGFDQEFRDIHSDWPSSSDDEKSGGTQLTADSSLVERAQSRFRNPRTRVEVLVDGRPQHRFEQLESDRFHLFVRAPSQGAPDELRPMATLGVDRSKPNLKVVVSPFREILQIDFREGDTVVEFDPPPGSRGEKRRQAMESSDLKRTAIPILEGLGKGGWALLILLLGPLLARLLPDWEIPDITLPSPPQMDLPVPNLPQMNLPTFDLSLDIPDLPELPEWVKVVIEHSNIWLPIVVGIVVGIVALRNHRKSEAQKRQWGETRDEREPRD